MRKAYFIFRFLLQHKINLVKMRIRKCYIGRRLTTYGQIFIRGKGKVTIGDDVTINSCREANPIGGDTKTILFAKETGRISIGNRVGMSNVTLVASNAITIEDDVMLGGSVKVYDNDFHSTHYEERVQSPDPGIKSAPVCIQRGAFVGAHTIILKGVTIGRRSVIGAGSVVTKNVPAGEVWAGNPARFVRKV